MEGSAEYLVPYREAIRRHGVTRRSLLWIGAETQEKRFDAMARLFDFRGRTVLDAGCGTADLLAWLVRVGKTPADYTGLEAIAEFAEAAEKRNLPSCRILRGDFLADPSRLFVGAEAVVFCGSLNTLDDRAFYASLERGLDACADVLLFNFLSSPDRAAATYLYWRSPAEVMRWARQLDPHARMLDDYLEGDCTVLVKRGADPRPLPPVRRRQ